MSSSDDCSDAADPKGKEVEAAQPHWDDLDIERTEPTSQLPEQSDVMEDEPPPKSLLRHLLGQLKVGMDLSKVTLPTFVLEPRSLLEKLTDFLMHTHLLTSIGRIEDPLDRMVQAVKWYLSGYHIRPKGVKKPYNPIIGETFQCTYHLEDGSELHYFAEQVSHHPPISCFFVESKANHLEAQGYYYPKSRFLGNSAGSIGEGHCDVRFTNIDETYRITWPNAYARGILFGTFLMEMGGKVKIVCEESGYYAEIEFKTKGFFGGEYNRIEAKVKHKRDKKTIRRVTGKWTDATEIKNEETGEVAPFFDPAEEPFVPMTVDALRMQAPSASRRIWRKVTRCLRLNEMDDATQHKTDIEEKQRKDRKVRAKRKEEWEIKYFHKVAKHEWVMNDDALEQYDKEKLEGQMEDLSLEDGPAEDGSQDGEEEEEEEQLRLV